MDSPHHLDGDDFTAKLSSPSIEPEPPDKDMVSHEDMVPAVRSSRHNSDQSLVQEGRDHPSFAEAIQDYPPFAEAVNDQPEVAPGQCAIESRPILQAAALNTNPFDTSSEDSLPTTSQPNILSRVKNILLKGSIVNKMKSGAATGGHISSKSGRTAGAGAGAVPAPAPGHHQEAVGGARPRDQAPPRLSRCQCCIACLTSRCNPDTTAMCYACSNPDKHLGCLRRSPALVGSVSHLRRGCTNTTKL